MLSEEKDINLQKITSIFAVDHGNVTKVFLFDDWQHMAFAFYGYAKEPLIEMKAANTFNVDPTLRQRQLIKGGQSIAMIDSTNN